MKKMHGGVFHSIMQNLFKCLTFVRLDNQQKSSHVSGQSS